MAHPCFQCGSECYCHGSWDDVIVEHTPKNCEGCGCSSFWGGEDDEDWDYIDDDTDNFWDEDDDEKDLQILNSPNEV